MDIYGDDTADNDDDGDDDDADDADDDDDDDIDGKDDDDNDDSADNDDDGNCLGWSLSPTQSVCLTVTLLKHSCYSNFQLLLATSTQHQLLFKMFKLLTYSILGEDLKVLLAHSTNLQWPLPC